MKVVVVLLILISFLFGSVDINTASMKELTILKGVVQTKAKAISFFRTTHCFKNIDELVLVKGIGKKTIENNRKILTASSCQR